MNKLRLIIAVALLLLPSLAHAQLTNGLQLYAGFNGNATDSSGNGRNGTLSGSPSYGTGKIGQGLDAEAGSSQYADHGNSVGIDNVAAFSWQVWYIPESLVDYQPILLKGAGTNTSRSALSHSGSGLGGNAAVLCSIANGANTYGYSGSVLSAGVPVHLVMVYDGSQTGNSNRLKLYVNGANSALNYNGTTIPATTANNPSLPFRVANMATSYGDGVFDEVAIWNRAITAGEVTQLYNGGNGLAYPFVAKINPATLNQILSQRIERRWICELSLAP